MGKKIGIGIAAIIVIIVIAAAVAPYFVGLSAESNFKSQVAYLNTQLAGRGIAVHVEAYDRGFYSSDAELSLSIKPGLSSLEVLKLWKLFLGSGGKPEFHLHINHGPVPFDAFGHGHWNFLPVLYTAALRGGDLPRLSILGALKAKLYVVQAFTGRTHARLSVPPGHLELGALGKGQWQGGYFDVHVNAARDALQYKSVLKPLDLRVMNFDDPQRDEYYAGHFDGWRFTGARHKVKYDFWVGTARGSFKNLKVTYGDEVVFKLAPARSRRTYEHSDNGDSVGGSLDFVQDGGEFYPLNFPGSENDREHATGALSRDAADRHTRAADPGQGWAFSNLSVNLTVAKLDAKGLRHVLNAVDAQTGDEPFGQDEPQILRALKAGTNASLAATLAAPTGTASFTAHARMDARPSDFNNMDEERFFRRHTHFKFKLNFDRKLVESFVSRVLRESTRSFDRLLRRAAATGYVYTGAQGRYHMRVQYRPRAGAQSQPGRIMVNGTPLKELGDPFSPPAQSAPAPASSN